MGPVDTSVDVLMTAADDAYRRGDMRKALSHLIKAWSLSPGLATIADMAGVVATRCGEPSKSQVFFSRAIQSEPDSTAIRLNFISFLLQQQCYSEALLQANRVVASDPDRYAAYNCRAVALHALDRVTTSLTTYRRAVSLDIRHNLRARTNLGQLLLSTRQYRSGWRHYATRFSAGTTSIKSDLPEYCPNQRYRRLLLWGDQGIGDQIMFGSMIADLRETTLPFALQVDDRLVGLFQRAYPGIEVFGESSLETSQYCDARLALGDLGGMFRDSDKGFSRQPTRYLAADPSRVEAWRCRLHGSARVPNIGISWRSANPDTGNQRSLSPEQLASVLAVPSATFVNLQYGRVEEDLVSCRSILGAAYRCHELPELDKTIDIENLAAVVEVCDLVLTIGNTTAHLAAALGKPTWVLLPKPAGWRWMHEGSRTPWYPSARLYRQHRLGDWSGVLADVQNDLRRWVAARGVSTAATQPNV